MQFRSIGQIIVDVIHARDWFKGIGISTTGTRLEKIHDYLDELLNPRTHDPNPLGTDVREEDTYYALSDGYGFGLIAAEISKLPPHLLPRQTLQDILKGPLAASEEATDSNDSRNKFVEMELAANLSSTGFKLLEFDDVSFEFENYRYVVECKRPSHDGTLDDNIHKAYAQLQARLEDSYDRGIVAVAVEKVFRLDGTIHKVESARSATGFAISIGKQFSGRIAKYEHVWVDPRVVGVLAIIRFLMRTNVPHLVGASYILGLVKFATPQLAQAAESSRLDRMIEALRTRFVGT